MRQSTVTAPYGFSPESWDIKCINRTGAAVAVGDIVSLDIAQTTAADNNRVGSSLSGLATIDGVVTANEGYGVLGVCLAAAADTDEVRIRVSGIVDAKVSRAGATTTILPGAPLIAATGKDYLEATLPTTGASEDRILGYFLDDATGTITANSGVLHAVMFDGVHGFSSLNSIA